MVGTTFSSLALVPKKDASQTARTQCDGSSEVRFFPFECASIRVPGE